MTPRPKDDVAPSCPARCLVALGGNVGDVAAAFRRSMQALAQTPGVVLQAYARLYRTPAQLLAGAAPQPDYLNAACTLTTTLSPRSLLARLQQLERDAGPRGNVRWAPRRLDLDLIAYENFYQHTAALTLPHPRAHLRPFVLLPLADIAADWRLPGQTQPIGALAAHLGNASKVCYATKLSWQTTAAFFSQ